MTRLMLVVFIMAGATLAGSFIVIALASGFDTTRPIVLAAIAGFVAAVPVSWLVARQLSD
ncbi:MAG: CTP synthetase [Gemmobacter sp.]